jgi:hypothetical protein
MTSGQRIAACGLLLAFALISGCSGDETSTTGSLPSASATKSSASPEPSAPQSGYASTSFVVPFDVVAPSWLSTTPNVEQPNFVTWGAANAPESPAVTFLVPVSVYRPGERGTTTPPEDYIGYLLSQSEFGTHFTDQTERTVGEQPATVVTATVDDSLDGSLGCPATDTSVGECFGLQADLNFRIAVVKVKGKTLLIWLQTSSDMDPVEMKAKTQAFDDMLASVRFR